MNLSMFDLVTSANVVAYWLEQNVNRQPMLGETLFPYKREIGIRLDWIKGASNQPIALRLSAFDAKAIRRDREGIEQYTTKMPFFKESMYIDEDLRQQLNMLLQTSNKELINSILNRIFADQIKLINASLVSLERMRMEALTSGIITLASNGVSYKYDYAVPADQKKTATKSWSDASADIIKDINDIVTAMRAKGVDITRAICNNSVVNDIIKNTNIKNQIYVLAGGNITSISSTKALNFIEQETGVVLYSYDNVYVDESGNATKYIPDDTIVFIPDGTLGETHMGVTPEESDLLNKAGSDVTMVNNGVAVTAYGTEDPVNVEMKVSMVALPSFERANEIVIFDTETE